MLVGVPKEIAVGERRVALTPSDVATLRTGGAEVVVEAGAGDESGYDDRSYQDKGARMARERAAALAADVLLCVRASADSLAETRAGQTIIGLAEPLTARDSIDVLAKTGATLFALELLPRITRAQSMDVLTSMATIAGYKAVLVAAERLPKLFPMMVTAAGTISPAKVLVIGAGVAGLQAIGTSRRLGAVVTAYDVRPEVKEQVESLGARFAELGLETESAQDERGYAKELDESVYERQRSLMAHLVAGSDVVVTTAAVPGKTAPRLITSQMVEAMRPGSVIVDLAAASGGNCELTEADVTKQHHGAWLFGPTNLPATVPTHASQMYGKNISAFLTNMMVNGELHIDLEDEVVRDTLITRDGAIVHPRLLPS